MFLCSPSSNDTPVSRPSRRAFLCKEWKCVGRDQAHPSAKVSPTPVNRHGCTPVGSTLDAAPR
jgi:hypothetical protein